jgi:hypothetical protein
MTEFRKGKCILVLDAGDFGNARWAARVELFEGMFRDMSMTETYKMLNESNMRTVPPSKVVAWVVDTWNAEYEKVDDAKLKTIREAGTVQEGWDIVEYHTFEDLEKVEKPIRTAAVAKKFGI